MGSRSKTFKSFPTRPALTEEWINSGELHRLQRDDGSVLICLNSLLARVRNTQTS